MYIPQAAINLSTWPSNSQLCAQGLGLLAWTPAPAGVQTSSPKPCLPPLPGPGRLGSLVHARSHATSSLRGARLHESEQADVDFDRNFIQVSRSNKKIRAKKTWRKKPGEKNLAKKKPGEKNLAKNT